MFDLTFLEFIQNFGLVILIVALLAIASAIALLMIAAKQIAEIQIPEDADFFETLQHVPITVPIALDLLDFVFDIFAAPIAWIILELLGLQALQMITMFEGIIPGTQLIPTMTGAWVISRMMKDKRSETRMRSALHDYQLRSRDAQYGQIDRSGRALAGQYRQEALAPPSPRSGRASSVIEGEYQEFDEDFDESPPEYYEEY